MQFMITGSPGSRHNLVGRMLAERLELNFYSAYDIAWKYYANKGAPYYLFKTHKDQEADNYVTAQVKELSNGVDFVLDSLFAKQYKNGTRICIHQDLLADKMRAASWYEDEVTECWFTHDDNLFGYSPDCYDITINRLYLTDEQVVSAIINSVTAGVLKANYVHPFQVLPLYPEYVPETFPDYCDKKMVFHTIRFGFIYLLTQASEYPQYLRYLRGQRLMNLDIKVDSVPSEKMHTEDAYPWLKYFIPTECRETLLLAYLLSKYCASVDAPDVKQTYLELSKNADPYKKSKEVVD